MMPIFFFPGLEFSVLKMISFLKKVAVCTGAFKSEGIFVCSTNQDPICFDMAIARWLPRSQEWMVSESSLKWDPPRQDI